MNGRNRTILLAAIMGVLGLLVVLHRMGGDSDAEADSGGLSAARDAYVREAMALERERAEVERLAAWKGVLAEARARYHELDGQMLVGQTRELAADQLRNRVKQVMRELGMNESSLTTRQVPSGGESNASTPIQVISSEIRFMHSDPAVIYQFMERLENLSGVRTMISTVSLAGPGRRLDRAEVDVTLTLHALALVEKEA